MSEATTRAANACEAAASGGLLGTLLSSMLERPACGHQLGEAAQGPARFQLTDDVEQVNVRVDAENKAAIDKGEDGREPLASASGAGEEEVPAGHGVRANAALGAAVIDLEAPIRKAAAEEGPLVDGVSRGLAQGGLRQEFGVNAVDPLVEGVEQWQRAPAALLAAGIGIEVPGLAVFLDGVEVGEVLEGDGSAPVLGDERAMELAADVHAAGEPALVGDGDEGLPVVVFDFAAVAGVAIDLDEAIDSGKPLDDLACLPAWSVAVGDSFLSADGAIGADEAPDVTAEAAMAARLVERTQVGIVGADDGGGEHVGEHSQGDGLDQVGGVGPVRLERLVGHVEAEARELAALAVNGQCQRTFLSYELGKQRGIDLAHHTRLSAAGSD